MARAKPIVVGPAEVEILDSRWTTERGIFELTICTDLGDITYQWKDTHHVIAFVKGDFRIRNRIFYIGDIDFKLDAIENDYQPYVISDHTQGTPTQREEQVAYVRYCLVQWLNLQTNTKVMERETIRMSWLDTYHKNYHEVEHRMKQLTEAEDALREAKERMDKHHASIVPMPVDLGTITAYMDNRDAGMTRPRTDYRTNTRKFGRGNRLYL